ncbi:hypothetical protein Pyrfu_0850 [Pyrolobus fumarii 1A]|uniref:4Fe-4S ferredoxin n=1 Tax=Pyrolobus fumarii (strain DSM 11204 / 1A) TaxID=694429 RepID=G0EDV0_PYRF1|nr:hypothetical protein Pyrfu_0850 [Pyrolobus fumarii 1A]
MHSLAVRCGRLIDSNAYPPCLRGLDCILIYSRCLEQLNPRILLDAKFVGCAAFATCPEEHHINMLGFKLAGMISRALPRRVAVLTVDGSMHCIQLHYMLEEVEKISGHRFERRHYVAVDGIVHEISPRVVRLSRFLSKLEKLAEQQE